MLKKIKVIQIETKILFGCACMENLNFSIKGFIKSLCSNKNPNEIQGHAFEIFCGTFVIEHTIILVSIINFNVILQHIFFI